MNLNTSHLIEKLKENHSLEIHEYKSLLDDYDEEVFNLLKKFLQ